MEFPKTDEELRNGIEMMKQSGATNDEMRLVVSEYVKRQSQTQAEQPHYLEYLVPYFGVGIMLLIVGYAFFSSVFAWLKRNDQVVDFLKMGFVLFLLLGFWGLFGWYLFSVHVALGGAYVFLLIIALLVYTDF